MVGRRNIDEIQVVKTARFYAVYGSVPDRTPPTTVGHDGLSLPAQSPCSRNIGARLHGASHGRPVMTDMPQLLLSHHLKACPLYISAAAADTSCVYLCDCPTAAYYTRPRYYQL